MSRTRERRDRHRSKSRDGLVRGDKSVVVQVPGDPLLDAESNIGEDRVRVSFTHPSLHFVYLSLEIQTASHFSQG